MPDIHPKTKLDRFRMLCAVLSFGRRSFDHLRPLDEGKSEEDVSVNLDTATFSRPSRTRRGAVPADSRDAHSHPVRAASRAAPENRRAEASRAMSGTPSGEKKNETAITWRSTGSWIPLIVYVAFDSQPADAVSRFFPARAKEPVVPPAAADTPPPENTAQTP
jgi:hypothetical protein